MILMKGAWVMKIKKIIIALSAAVMITAVCGLVFGFYIDEFTYKLRCIDCIISGFSVFKSENKRTSNRK